MITIFFLQKKIRKGKFFAKQKSRENQLGKINGLHKYLSVRTKKKRKKSSTLEIKSEKSALLDNKKFLVSCFYSLFVGAFFRILCPPNRKPQRHKFPVNRIQKYRIHGKRRTEFIKN